MSTELARRNGPQARPSALATMAARLDVPMDKLHDSLKQTAFKGASDAEMLTLVVVANQFGLNPFLRQIYAFPAKGGGIVPVVGIDGWSAIANAHDDWDGVEFEEKDDEAMQPHACTCVMHMKNRAHPVKVTEYMSECRRGTEPWKTHPRRMLRHKAFIQACRLAFGLGAIYDEEDARAAAAMATYPEVIDVPGQPAPSRQARLAKQIAAAPAQQPEPEPAPEPDVVQPEPPPQESQEDPAVEAMSQDAESVARTIRSAAEKEPLKIVNRQAFEGMIVGHAKAIQLGVSPAAGAVKVIEAMSIPQRVALFHAIREGRISRATGEVRD